MLEAPVVVGDFCHPKHLRVGDKFRMVGNDDIWQVARIGLDWLYIENHEGCISTYCFDEPAMVEVVYLTPDSPFIVSCQ